MPGFRLVRRTAFDLVEVICIGLFLLGIVSAGLAFEPPTPIARVR